jgi:hypothetical protein
LPAPSRVPLRLLAAAIVIAAAAWLGFAVFEPAGRVATDAVEELAGSDPSPPPADR